MFAFLCDWCHLLYLSISKMESSASLATVYEIYREKLEDDVRDRVIKSDKFIDYSTVQYNRQIKCVFKNSKSKDRA